MTLGEVFNSTSIQLKEITCWAYNHPREAIMNKKTLLSSLAFVSIAACAYALKNQKYAFSGLVITSLCTFTYVVYRKNIDSDEGPEDNDQANTISILAERPKADDPVHTMTVFAERFTTEDQFNPIEAMTNQNTLLSSSSLAFAFMVACAYAFKNPKYALLGSVLVSLATFTCLVIASLATSAYVVYRKNIDNEGYEGRSIPMPILSERSEANAQPIPISIVVEEAEANAQPIPISIVAEEAKAEADAQTIPNDFQKNISNIKCTADQFKQFKINVQGYARDVIDKNGKPRRAAIMSKHFAQMANELLDTCRINADKIINTIDNKSHMKPILTQEINQILANATKDAEEINKLANNVQALANQFFLEAQNKAMAPD
ncbi:MAG: hypothetical protein ACOVOR_04000 [Rhabdochlamydiaceae bacterium]